MELFGWKEAQNLLWEVAVQAGSENLEETPPSASNHKIKEEQRVLMSQS